MLFVILVFLCGCFLAWLRQVCDGGMKTLFSSIPPGWTVFGVQHVGAHSLMLLYNNMFCFDVYFLSNGSWHLICIFGGYGAVRWTEWSSITLKSCSKRYTGICFAHVHLFKPNFIWHSVPQPVLWNPCAAPRCQSHLCSEYLWNHSTLVPFYRGRNMLVDVLKSTAEPLEGHGEARRLLLPCASCCWISCFSMGIRLFLRCLSSPVLLRAFGERCSWNPNQPDPSELLWFTHPLSPTRIYNSMVAWLPSTRTVWALLSVFQAFIFVPPESI